MTRWTNDYSKPYSTYLGQFYEFYPLLLCSTSLLYPSQFSVAMCICTLVISILTSDVNININIAYWNSFYINFGPFFTTAIFPISFFTENRKCCQPTTYIPGTGPLSQVMTNALPKISVDIAFLRRNKFF